MIVPRLSLNFVLQYTYYKSLFCLLALSKVLTCEAAPTGGDILVFGRSIKSDANAIRRMVGVCKQDDYLWPNLSAKEHLDLFAGLRGVDPITHEATVQKWLESVDLDSVQHQHSSQFSGGMKRRLSLAMSTIGSRALIVLDEPTTGKCCNHRHITLVFIAI